MGFEPLKFRFGKGLIGQSLVRILFHGRFISSFIILSFFIYHFHWFETSSRLWFGLRKICGNWSRTRDFLDNRFRRFWCLRILSISDFLEQLLKSQPFLRGFRLIFIRIHRFCRLLFLGSIVDKIRHNGDDVDDLS